MSTEMHSPNNQLLQRRRPIEEGGQILCPKCKILLHKPKWKEYEDFGWCSKCKNWYYIKDLPRRQTPHKIKKERYFGTETTEALRKKMSQWFHHFQEEIIPSTVKIWTSDEYDQKFLKSLVPKKE